MNIEQLMLRLPVAHTGWSVDNIVKNLAYDGSTSSLIGYVIWFSMCGLMLIGCVWVMIQTIRHPPPSIFGPIPGRARTPNTKDTHGVNEVAK